jgi:hypothetical protein
LVTRQERIDDFIQEGSPPNDVPLQILCEDHVGTYVIPFPCPWRAAIWESAKTSRRVEATVVGWRARTLPFGTRIKVCHHGCVVVRINDRGPFVAGRHIDLTPAAARAIGLNDTGYVSLYR